MMLTAMTLMGMGTTAMAMLLTITATTDMLTLTDI
jgi:hypothetical protein